MCRSASPLLLWPPHCPLWTRCPLSAANRAFTKVHNRPHESTPAILRCFRQQDITKNKQHFKGRHKSAQGSNLWVESGLICGENERFCLWKLNERTALHWDTSWCALAQVWETCPYCLTAAITSASASHPVSKYWQYLNTAACSFYWPTRKDISPKTTTITPLWPVKSLRWTSVSLDAFNSQECLQQEVWGIKKTAMKLLHRLQMAMRRGKNPSVWESRTKWHPAIHQPTGQLLQMWRIRSEA